MMAMLCVVMGIMNTTKLSHSIHKKSTGFAGMEAKETTQSIAVKANLFVLIARLVTNFDVRKNGLCSMRLHRPMDDRSKLMKCCNVFFFLFFSTNM